MPLRPAKSSRRFIVTGVPPKLVLAVAPGHSRSSRLLRAPDQSADIVGKFPGATFDGVRHMPALIKGKSGAAFRPARLPYSILRSADGGLRVVIAVADQHTETRIRFHHLEQAVTVRPIGKRTAAAVFPRLKVLAGCHRDV